MPIFTISTTSEVIDELKILAKTGHYGNPKNFSEAAERIITDELNRLFPMTFAASLRDGRIVVEKTIPKTTKKKAR